MFETSKPKSKVIGVQFGLLSPDEIRSLSVAEITSRDTYINDKPVVGGIFDPRMGVLEPGLICPTDGYNNIQCPGYFGHIELARPVFYIQYLATVIKILRTICYKCSKILISKEKYHTYLKDMNSADRWSAVFQQANKIKRCGDDSEDGCGCKQPAKIKKEGLSTIIVEWNIEDDDDADGNKKMSVKLTPEMIIKMFSRISHDDMNFMGFSSAFSRPEWMICQVLAVPPPSVRPSVKHNIQQRSEDDISHIIINIIKHNNTLLEKMADPTTSQAIIDDATMMLQYYIATMVDNNISGVASVAQRSGRPLKSIKERLNGKQGRVRGNLMGKRVDFSARSVITPDPNISISELGIPLKIAKNLTRPVTVNKLNIGYLMTLVKNGPDVYPGAKILKRKNGENISLKYIDRESISLSYGDVVHRHILDGDGVLFNRQPTLHRMSMMCHTAKVMKKGNTFRLNVAVTKPYNADFDGDEMNLHMPQDIESECELKNLAAVDHHIVSPANNQSIVGIFQDSLLGAFLFTNKVKMFSKQAAMNLLMNSNKVDARLFEGDITNFDIISSILPPLTLNYKTKMYNDNNADNSNFVIDIKKGEMKSGNIDKSVFGSCSKGLIQRICNDYSNETSKEFIDNIQAIVTTYMKEEGYSVGISDLIADPKTNADISEAISKKKNDVQQLIYQTRLGIFENKTGQTNVDEFEMQVNNILNAAASEAGKLGRENLSKDNRFVIMVNAGSKGSDLNISQMIATLGQQNVDGKRIPYGFDSRTLPHFQKYDDSPQARGFIQSSFINGLTPAELFFHAQAGRVGLIDTAVKTSQTGYIQRRLIKACEDLMVAYDMTVRNNKGKIVQFRYGDDSADPVKVEAQNCPIVTMSLEDIYIHFNIVHGNALYALYNETVVEKLKTQKTKTEQKIKSFIDSMIYYRAILVKNVFNHTDESKVYLPVAFNYIINNVYNQMRLTVNSLIDISILDGMNMIEEKLQKLETHNYAAPNDLFKIMYHYYLSPAELFIKRRFNKKALIYLLETIELMYLKSLAAPGDMVGIIAAQSIGEPTTQMTLNTFHFAGVASKSNVTKGVPRVEEILSLSDNLKKPSLTIYLHENEEHDRHRAINIMNNIECTKLKDIVLETKICFDPGNTLLPEDQPALDRYLEFEKGYKTTENINDNDLSNWIVRIELNRVIMLEKNITMDDIQFAIYKSYKDEVECVYSDYNDDALVFRLRMKPQLKSATKQKSLDESDNIYMLTNLKDYLLNNLVIRGIQHIEKVIVRLNPNVVKYKESKFERSDIWVLDTIGLNLIEILGLDYICAKRTISNSITEVYRTLGIEAARMTIYNEFIDVLADNDTYINERHLTLLCDRMSYSASMISIFRHGINNDNIGPLAKASFEETPEQFLKAARHGELDEMRGVSASIMCGQEGHFGTNAFQTYLDIEQMKQLKEQQVEAKVTIDMTPDIENPNDPCSMQNLGINNAKNISANDTGALDDEYDLDIM